MRADSSRPPRATSVGAASLSAALLALALTPTAGHALPTGPRIFCETYPQSPFCAASVPACTMCHTAPPLRNVYGLAVEAQLVPGQARPLSQAAFDGALPSALRASNAADSDGDMVTNIDEITAGTRPDDATSRPDPGGCETQLTNPRYRICAYDRVFAYRKVNVDFCGLAPTYEQIQTFSALSETAQEVQLDATLESCLASEHWIGRDGVLWNMAYRKVRPIQALKSGEGEGLFPLGDYFDDFNLFVYASTADRDVRDLLRATYYVTRSTGPATVYSTTMNLPGHSVPVERRAGMLTQQWFLVYFIMFSPLQRTMAAQAYRAYLGLDIARLEGLYPPPIELRDYDQVGVTAPACAGCHGTLDALTYPFRDYDGLVGRPIGRYTPNRLPSLFGDRASTLRDVPEAGYVLGQPVADLREWVEVAVASDAFASAMVSDYWRLLIGRPPEPTDTEFTGLWQSLRGPDNYRISAMLRRLIRTEAYGVP